MDDATSRAREAIAAYLRNIDVIPGSMAYGMTKTNGLLSALSAAGLAIIDTRTHAAVAREPDEMTIDAVRRAIFAATRYLPFPGLLFSKRDEIARAAIAALVGGQTQGGEE